MNVPRCLALALLAAACWTSTATPAPEASPDTDAPAAAPVLVDLDVPETPVAGLTLRRVRHRDRTFRVATLDLRQVTLRLAGQGPAPTRTFSELAAALDADGQRLVWGTNAGIFHPGERPAGLFIAGGTVHRDLETADGGGNFYLKPNGALLIDGSGARIRTTAELAGASWEGVVLATQSGPLLSRRGRLHPALMPESPNLLLRSGVGVSDPHTVHLAISEGAVRFHELATLFRDGLDAPDALYLDGVISQWVDPTRPPGPTDGRYAGLLYVSAPSGAEGPAAE